MKEVGKTNQVVVLFHDELAAIDDYQFASRFKNRGETIRKLIRRGLASVRLADR